MKKFVKSKLFGFIILMVMAIVTVISGASSFSRFEMNYHDEIIAEYADFCLSHDGEGKSTILTTIVGNDSYSHEGSMSVSVVNQIEKNGVLETSLRMIEFTMRTPTQAEIDKEVITDVWGQKVCDITKETSNYDVVLTDEYGNILSDHVSLGIKNGEVIEKDVKNVNLLINRKKGIDEIDGIEKITIVIETSKPYKNTLAFTISVSNRKIMFTSSISDYFSNEDLKVDIITSHSYVFDNSDQNSISNNPVKIVLTYTNASLVFDYERFRLSVLGNLFKGDEEFSNQYNYATNTITLYLMPGSDVDLHFYIKDNSYSISAKVYFDMDEDNAINLSSGIDKDYTHECAGLSHNTETLMHYVVNK